MLAYSFATNISVHYLISHTYQEQKQIPARKDFLVVKGTACCILDLLDVFLRIFRESLVITQVEQ